MSYCNVCGVKIDPRDVALFDGLVGCRSCEREFRRAKRSAAFNAKMGGRGVASAELDALAAEMMATEWCATWWRGRDGEPEELVARMELAAADLRVARGDDYGILTYPDDRC